MRIFSLYILCHFLIILPSFSQVPFRLDLDRMDSLAQKPVTVLGTPVLLESDYGNYLEFNGINSGIQLDTNLLIGANSFTVEAIIRPYSGGSYEQRFLNFEQDDDNRLLMELRSTNGQWSLDTYIKSGSSSKTLLDLNIQHGSDKWYHVALVYENSMMTHYVNGVKELTGAVTFVPVMSGKTSLGVRLNKISWYKGAIKTVKMTPKAVLPVDFILHEAQQLNGDALGLEESLPGFQNSIQLFPNPSSSISTMRYHLSRATHVEIKLCSALGNEIKRIAEQNLEAGDHSIEVSFPSGTTAGVYIIWVKTDNTILKKTIVFSGSSH